MANNIAVSITADVADLQVKRAIMTAELRAVSKDLNDFAKTARAAGSTDELRASMLASADAIARTKNQLATLDQELKTVQASAISSARGQQQIVATSAQNSAALKNLSFQLNDVATGFATGMPPMMIFAQQGSQIVQAFQMMEGGGNAVTRFLGGPWGMALTAATVVIAPFIAKLMDGKSALQENAEALEKVKLGDSGLSDAQRVLGQMFDLTTGKLKDQNEMLRANAALVAAKMRAEGFAERESSKQGLSDDGTVSSVRGFLVDDQMWAMNIGNTRKNMGEVLRLVHDYKAGVISASDAIRRAEGIDFSGSKRSRDEFNQAIIDAEQSKQKLKTADEIDNSLNSKKLDAGLIKTDKKKGGGVDVTSQWAEQLHAQEIASGEFFKDQTANELKFWQDKLGLTTAGSKDWLAVQGHIYEASRALAHQDYQDKLADYNERIQADRNDWSKQQVDWQDKLTFIRGKFSEQSAEYKNAFRDFTRARQDHNAREMASEAQHASRMIESLRSSLNEQASLRDTQAQTQESVLRANSGGSLGGEAAAEQAIARLHAQLTMQKIADNELLHDKESSSLDATLAKAQNIYGADVSQYQNLIDAKEKADERYRNTKRSLDAQMRAQNIQDILAVQRTYSGYISGMVGSTVSGFAGVLTGQATWAQATKGVFNSVMGSITNRISDMVTDWVVKHVFMTTAQRAQLAIQASQHAAAHTAKTAATTAATAAQTGVVAAGKTAEVGITTAGEAAKTGAVAVGTATRTATEVAGAATSVSISATSSLARIAHSAAVAAAGAYAALAAIPVIGPVIAPVAAAAALVGVIKLGQAIFSAEGGMDDVPYDNAPFLLHKNEMVLPADIAAPLRTQLRQSSGRGGFGAMADAGASSSNISAGGDTHHHNWQIQAFDGHSVKRMLMDHRGPIAEALRKYTRDGGR